jgi:hypothetical protein
MYLRNNSHRYAQVLIQSFVLTLILLNFSIATHQSKILKNVRDRRNVIDNASMIVPLESGVLTFPGQQNGKNVPITGNLDQLKKFFNALKNANHQKVRIAHFGDSMILGDLITEYLRANLQRKYGGGGIGFLPVVSDDYKMRRASRVTFSNDWTYASIVSGNKNNMPLGINGAVSLPSINSWVQYETTSVFSTTSYFDVAKVYYSSADQNTSITYNDKDIFKTAYLIENKGIQQLEIQTNGNTKKLWLKFNSGKAPYIFGVSLETNKNGILIDNFPLRGNSGVSLLDIDEKILRQFNNYLSYDLIILQFGTNIDFPTSDGYVLYENKMTKVINVFKRAFPNAGILIIGISDKTIKKDSRFVTNPNVGVLLETQKKIVTMNKLAFWNMWEAMGGYNSMNKWVNAAPPLALRDYSHFTTEGGAVIADLLTKAIEEASRK